MSPVGYTQNPSNESARELADLNLSFLLLAQRMLREDRHAATLRLGMSKELADVLLHLTAPQTVKLAQSNFALCSFRFEDAQSLRVLTRPHLEGHEQAHLSIVLASRGVQQQERLAA